MILEILTYALYLGVGILAISVGILLVRGVWAILQELGSSDSRSDFVHRRGPRLLDQEDAARNGKALATLTEQANPEVLELSWGGLHLPLFVAWTHFLIQGMTGSGKTVLLKMLLESILRLVGTGKGFRAVIADPKREMAAIAHTISRVHVRLSNLNPFDVSGVAWAIGEDVLTPAEADQFAEMIIPEDKNENNPYYRNNARGALRSLVIALQYVAPKLWTFRDIVLLSRTPALLAEVLALCPATKSFAAQHFAVQKTGREIVSTLGSMLGKYETISACWDCAPRAVSLRRFLDEEEVLILGYDDSIKAPLMALYPLMVKFLADWILLRNDPSKPTFFVIDEFRLFGKCDLTPIAIKGREARASLVIAFQDVNGIEALLGEKEARELFGNLVSKCFLAVDSEAAAKFASESFGKEEGSEYTTGITDGPSGRSTSWTEKIVQRELIMADEVKDLPLPSWQVGTVKGYFKSPYTKGYEASIRFRDVIERMSPPEDFPKYTQRPADEQRLRPLAEADFNRLNIPITPVILATI